MNREDSRMPNDSSSGPLFVVGMWRSGTSLLYTLLNQNPQIALMYEGDLALLRPLFWKGKAKADWMERWEFWNSALTRHNIETGKIPATVSDLNTAATAVWKQHAGLAIMGDKSPDYYDSLQFLAREFPGARFIVIWRDLADICRSMIRARAGSSFFSKPGITHRAVIGYYKLKLECHALLSQKIPVHQIQYEEMIQKPDEVMAGICQFLKILFDPRMTSLEGADRSAIYDGSHHSEVKGKTILSSKEREEVLSPRLRRKIERYVSYWQEECGGTWPRYPRPGTRNSGHPSRLERFWDELLFRGLRTLDDFTVFVYCYAPFGLLQSYRSFKNRRYRTPEAEPKAAPLPESSTVESVR